MVKNPPVKAGNIKDQGLIPGWGGSPRVGNSNPLQYSYLENPMHREAWSLHRAAKESDTTEMIWHTGGRGISLYHDHGLTGFYLY